jgi:UDPglucose 6-dehydrogenase
VVIGTTSEKQEVLLELYAPFVRQGNPIIFMDEESAELTIRRQFVLADHDYVMNE